VKTARYNMTNPKPIRANKEMKYKLTKNKKKWGSTTLFQIEATVAFGSIAKGEAQGII
jgi:hypothetical protein